MFELLSSYGYQINNNHNLVGHVTWERLRDGIINFFTDPSIKPSDTLLFYYSGHGVPDEYGDVYFATSEIDQNHPYKRGFSFDELTKMFQRTVSSRVVVILDCCYSGSATLSKGHEEDKARLGTAAIDSHGKGRCILSASQELQEAYELEEKGHSLFTNYLLEGLQGKDQEVFDRHGNITIMTLSNYTYDKIMSLTKGPRQKPLVKMETSGDIILVDKTYFPEIEKLKPTPKISVEEYNDDITHTITPEAQIISKSIVTGKITERTLYPQLIRILNEYGGTGVSEIRYNSEPDIVFNMFDKQWLLAVRIGETATIIKDAVIQYQRHKDESKIENGILLFFSEEIRRTKPNQKDILTAIRQKGCTCLVDAQVHEELRNLTFPQVILRIQQEVIPAISRRETKAFPLETVINLLQLHVSEMMQDIRLS